MARRKRRDRRTLWPSSVGDSSEQCRQLRHQCSGLTANNGNYNFVQAAGNANALTIDPATLTYAAKPASRTYGSANPSLREASSVSPMAKRKRPQQVDAGFYESGDGGSNVVAMRQCSGLSANNATTVSCKDRQCHRADHRSPTLTMWRTREPTYGRQSDPLGKRHRLRQWRNASDRDKWDAAFASPGQGEQCAPMRQRSASPLTMAITILCRRRQPTALTSIRDVTYVANATAGLCSANPPLSEASPARQWRNASDRDKWTIPRQPGGDRGEQCRQLRVNGSAYRQQRQLQFRASAGNANALTIIPRR